MRALLLVCCMTIAATAAPVPKGAIEAPKPKDVEEAKKAARYKALREGYETMRDSLPKDSAERLDLEGDMNLAREIAQERLDIEKIAELKLKALFLETWETSVKPLTTKTPRRKELSDIYYYELSQKAGSVPPTPPTVRDFPDRSLLPRPYPHQTVRDPA